MTAPRHLGAYRVLGLLGQGQFGTVYVCEGEVPGVGFRRVAIKQLRVWSMGGFETLVREYELLAMVRHRSLCRVYEFLDREMAVVMEYVEGVNLRTVLDALAARHEVMWADAALAIGIELADCLVQSWATPGPNGALALVHRDIKPENIMLTPKGEVKLLDFGLAAIDEPVDSGVQGTPLYMAPEQALGERVDHRSDLFSLGLVVFELILGEPTYPIPTVDRESRIDAVLLRVERADLVGEIARLRVRHPRVADARGRCLARDPARRPHDGHELAADLRRCLTSPGADALGDFAAYYFDAVGPLRPRFTPSTAADPGMMAEADAPRDVEPPPQALGGRREAMANPPPRPGGPPPRPTAPQPGPSQARPRPAAPAAPPRPAMGGKAWTPPAKDAKPVGAPATPPPASEPQNLRMVPLSREGDDPEIGAGKPSTATEFFALPKRPQAEELSELRRTDPIQGASRPAKPAAPAPAGPPPGSMPHGAGVAGPGLPPGMPMAMPMGISGPVANGGLPPGYGAYAHGSMPPDASDDLERAKSYRVFAVVAGLMMMVMSAVVVSVMVLAYGFYLANQQQVAAPREIPQVAPPPKRVVDTGGGKAEPPPPPQAPKPAGGGGGGGGGGPKPPSEPKPPKPPAPPAPVASGPVTLNIAATEPYNKAELKCDSGIRQQASFAGGVATLTNVPGPGSDSCKVVFKGGGGLPAATVVGGRSYSCSFQGTVAVCK